jgi:hypothetical protein
MSKYRQQSHVARKCDYPIASWVWRSEYRFRILTGIVKDMEERGSQLDRHKKTL